MKQAILAAEDERFYQHGGVDYLSVAAGGRANLASRDPAGRRHDHHAGRAQLLPDPREDGHPQAARGPARLEDRGQPDQGRDPRALRQPDLPRPARLRLRRRVADLFRQAAEGRHGRRGGDARRAAQGAVGVQPGHQPEARQDAPALRAAPDARPEVHQRRRSSGKHKPRHWRSGRGCARRSRRTPSTSPRWRGRSCSRPTARTPTPRASPSTRRSARPTRRPPMLRCGAACSTTTGATATAARRPIVSLPDDAGRARSGARAAVPGNARQRRPRRRPSCSRPSPTEVKAVLADGETVAITGDGLKFAARALTRQGARGARASGAGAVIRARRGTTRAAGRSRSCRRSRRRSSRCGRSDGAILALVGGFDFDRNKFNHVTQAQRQPGSAFKPFIYSAALEKGFTPATIINDAPFFVPGRRRPAARTGSPRTTTASSKARCACAPRSPSRRTWSRSACCRRSARSTRRTTSRASASTPSCTRPT